MQHNILLSLYKVCSSNREFSQIRFDRYVKFIESRRLRIFPITAQTKFRHHILPCSYIRKFHKMDIAFDVPSASFSNSENIVVLTLREHQLAHWMLAKISKCRSMNRAFLRISKNGKNLLPKHRRALDSIVFTNSTEARRKMSEAKKGKRRKPHSEETKKKISEGNLGKPCQKYQKTE